jgi:hypothetical protein
MKKGSIARFNKKDNCSACGKNNRVRRPRGFTFDVDAFKEILSDPEIVNKQVTHNSSFLFPIFCWGRINPQQLGNLEHIAYKGLEDSKVRVHIVPECGDGIRYSKD